MTNFPCKTNSAMQCSPADQERINVRSSTIFVPSVRDGLLKQEIDVCMDQGFICCVEAVAFGCYRADIKGEALDLQTCLCFLLKTIC